MTQQDKNRRALWLLQLIASAVYFVLSVDEIDDEYGLGVWRCLQITCAAACVALASHVLGMFYDDSESDKKSSPPLTTDL